MPGYRYKLYDCEVRLAGDPAMSIPRNRVTVPELFVLKSLHGPNALVNIRPAMQLKNPKDPSEGMVPSHFNNVAAGAEVQRLRDAYNKPGKKIVDRLFPGAFPQLPASLKEIGLVAYAPPVALEEIEEEPEEIEETDEDPKVETIPTPDDDPVKQRILAGQAKRIKNAQGKFQSAAP